MTNKKAEQVKIVQPAETSNSLLDDPNVAEVLGNTTNTPRPETAGTSTDAVQVGRIEAATTKAKPTTKKSRGRPKGTTKAKDPKLADIKCNFAVVLPPEDAQRFSALVEKLDNEGVGKVNANIALKMAVNLLFEKYE